MVAEVDQVSGLDISMLSCQQGPHPLTPVFTTYLNQTSTLDNISSKVHIPLFEDNC